MDFVRMTANKITGANAGGHLGCRFGRAGPPASLIFVVRQLNECVEAAQALHFRHHLPCWYNDYRDDHLPRSASTEGTCRWTCATENVHERSEHGGVHIEQFVPRLHLGMVRPTADSLEWPMEDMA